MCTAEPEQEIEQYVAGPCPFARLGNSVYSQVHCLTWIRVAIIDLRAASLDQFSPWHAALEDVQGLLVSLGKAGS